MPPITPEPSSISQNWCRWMPSADTSMPPHQQSIDTSPALRGPARSSQPPNTAADEPRKTKNRVYIQPSVDTRQSQPVANSSPRKPVPSGQACGALIPTAFDNGSQNTLKP